MTVSFISFNASYVLVHLCFTIRPICIKLLSFLWKHKEYTDIELCSCKFLTRHNSSTHQHAGKPERFMRVSVKTYAGFLNCECTDATNVNMSSVKMPEI